MPERTEAEATLIANYPTETIIIERVREGEVDVPGATYKAYWQRVPYVVVGGSTRQAALEYLLEQAAESKRLEDAGTP